MKNKITFQYNDTDMKKILNHFYGVPKCWLQVEFEDFDIIHPNGNESCQKILEKAIKIDFNNYEEELNKNNLENSGGVYFIGFENLKSIYIGETLNFKDRFFVHKRELENNSHYNNSLLKAYKNTKSGNCSFYILENGEVNNLNKAEFKIYCMKRENYYIELFRNNNKTVFNKEDTLHSFYMGYEQNIKSETETPLLQTKKAKEYNWLFLLDNKKLRPHSMDDLKLYGKYINPHTTLQDEEEKYKIIQKILSNRHNNI